MQTKNYHKDNGKHIHDCVIHGAIICDKNEWELIKRYLLQANKAFESGQHDMLKKRLLDTSRIEYPNGDKSYSLGVNATWLIFKKFNLSRYKQQNYEIIISKK